MTSFSGPWQIVSLNVRTFLSMNPNICLHGYDLDVHNTGMVDLRIRYSR